MGREETLKNKQEQINRLREHIQRSQGFLFADFSGLKANEITELRKNLKEVSASFHVIKNTYLKRSVEGTNYSEFLKNLTGPTALIYIYKDPVEVAKRVLKFAKAHKELKLKGGFIDHTFISEKEVELYAKLPSYNELISMTIGAISAPMRNFLGILKARIFTLLRVLEELKNKKSL